MEKVLKDTVLKPDENWENAAMHPMKKNYYTSVREWVKNEIPEEEAQVKEPGYKAVQNSIYN
jgi:hypothetical protein